MVYMDEPGQNIAAVDFVPCIVSECKLGLAGHYPMRRTRTKQAKDHNSRGMLPTGVNRMDSSFGAPQDDLLQLDKPASRMNHNHREVYVPEETRRRSWRTGRGSGG